MSPTYRSLLSLVLALVSGLVAAQAYPTRPVHIFTTLPGASNDMMARMLAADMTPTLGQPVVVENRPAGPVLATSVSKAAPDGYSVLIWAGGLWLGPLLEPQPYALSDFTPITLLTRSPNLLVVHPSVPARSVPDLIKYAKANPGKLNFSAGTIGSSSLQAGELFKYLSGTDIVRITYKGGSQEAVDLMAGRIQMTFGNVTNMIAAIKSGKLVLLGQGGPKRSVLFPDVSTITETLPGFISEQYFAMWAPAGTPATIVQRINKETARVMEKPDVREKLLGNALEVSVGTPEQLLELAHGEVARVSKLIKDTGLKAE